MGEETRGTGGRDRRSRPWWASEPDAGDRGSPGSGHDDTEPAHGPHASVEACQVCPVCAVIRVVGDARPELVEHLAEAVHHLGLAARAVLDAHAEAFPRHGENVERIRLDDE